MTEPEDLRKVAEGLGLAGDHYVPGQVAAILARLQADREEIERLKESCHQNHYVIGNARLQAAVKRAEASEARVKELEDHVQRLKDRLVWAEHSVADARSLGISLGTSNLKRKVASLEKEREEARAWKDAVTDACVVSWVNWEDGNPRKVINDLMCWEQKVALDPVVSKAAADLRAEGKREGIEGALDAIRKAYDKLEGGPAAQERAVLAAVRALLTESAGEGKGER